jgi:hypothetical protein
MKINIFQRISLIILIISLFCPEIRSAEEPMEVDEKPEKIYKKFQNVSEKFLNSEQILQKTDKKTGFTIKELLTKFKKDYLNLQCSLINVTDFSARVRICILKEIIKIKFETLPKNIKNHFIKMEKFEKTYEHSWKNLESNKFWSVRAIQLIDQNPTIIKIGNFQYKWEMIVSCYQPGGGKIYGLKDKEIPDTFWSITKDLQSYSMPEREVISNKLLQQKKDGKTIISGLRNIYKSTYRGYETIVTDQFLNGLNLLLDYEVARRLIAGDIYSDLPLISIMDCLIKNLNNDGILNKYFSLPDYSQSMNQKTLFSGESRENKLKELILTKECLNNITKQNDVRKKLRYCHESTPEEDSGSDANYDTIDDEKLPIHGNKNPVSNIDQPSASAFARVPLALSSTNRQFSNTNRENKLEQTEFLSETNSDDQFKLARIYREKAKETEDKEAQSKNHTENRYFREAEKGHVSAQYNLGFMYENGIETEKDDAEAAKWYFKAAVQGYKAAENRLKVLANTHTDAQFYLAWIYREKATMTENEKSKHKNNDKAAKLFRRAAEEGHILAQDTVELFRL